MPAPAPSPAPQIGPPPEAVALFEATMESMQRHEYADAATGFRTLVDRFPAERALLDRSRVYLDLCERELRKRPAAPRTIEERLTAATAALNNGDLARAEGLVHSVLGDDPRQDLALYILAAIEARRGRAEAALGRLREAIALSPEAGAQARFDSDFESLFTNETFRSLTEARPNHRSNSRRPRRPRAEG
jgi:tetratricopeptide (TPR) repeat protein